MKRYDQVAGFVLAGGASSRMGRDKALLRIAGVPLVVRTALLLRPLTLNTILVGSPQRYAALHFRGIPDRLDVGHTSNAPACGPLGGIASALMTTRSSWNLIVACDLPYLSQTWLEWLISRAIRSRAQAVVPRTVRGLEPLAAVYHRESSAPITAALARGVRKVSQAILELGPEVIEERAWRHLDPGGMVLRNMNTPEDYAEARRRAPRMWGDVSALLNDRCRSR